MKIIALSDIHGKTGYLKFIENEIENADVVVISGDITNFTSKEDAMRVIGALRKHNPNILAVGGNCDMPPVDEYLLREGINLNCNCIKLNGVTFAGICGGMPSGEVDENQTLEEYFTDSLKKLQAKTADCETLVFVSHQPAKYSAVDGFGGGSQAIADFIKSRQPILALSGHIHESAGKDTIGNSILVNPGSFAEGSYAIIEIDNKKLKNVQIKHA